MVGEHCKNPPPIAAPVHIPKLVDERPVAAPPRPHKVNHVDHHDVICKQPSASVAFKCVLQCYPDGADNRERNRVWIVWECL